VIGQQRSRESVESGLARNLCLVRRLLLVWQIQIFEPLFGVGLFESKYAARGVSLPCSSMLVSMAVRRSSSSRR